jgi:hypothetical protein
MACIKLSARTWRLTSVLLVLAASALAGCSAQAEVQPTPTPTVNPTKAVPASAIDPTARSESMLEYENLAAGFRVQYPSEWTVDRSQDTAVAIEFPIALSGVIGVRAGFFMIGARLSEIEVTDLDGLWASFAESLSESARLDDPAEYQIGGVPGYQGRFVDDEIQAQGWLLTVISGEQGYVLIEMVQPPVHFETFQPVFQAMLDSVELFEPAPAE